MNSSMISAMSGLPLFDIVKALSAADRYFRSGKIAALNGKRRPQYVYCDGTRCIVGAMLSDYLSRATLFPNNRLKVAYLMKQGQLRIGERDLAYLQLLQTSHDDVCLGKSTAEEFLEIVNMVKTIFEELEQQSAIAA
jgi:hypothetical protein